jgi:hypothetical protein
MIQVYGERHNPKLSRMKIFGLDDIIGGVVGAAGSLIAGQIQSSAAKNAAKQGNQILSDANGQARSDLAPYRDAGTAAVSKLQSTALNPQQFSMADFYNDPGYQFTLNQGNQAIERSAAARGGLLSGAAGKAIAGYTSNLANQTYGDAFNRYMQNRQQGYNELSGVANLGLNSTNSTVNAGINTAGQQAANTVNAVTGAGNAGAAGVVGATNAGQSSLSDYYLQQQLGAGGKIAKAPGAIYNYGYGGYGQ